jgi:hypothetical protein
MYRVLTTNEEIDFRQWARDNFKAGNDINGSWHPVVIDECNKIVQEYYIKLKNNVYSTKD